MRYLNILCVLLALPACNVFNEPLPSCTSNAECTTRMTAGSDTEVPAMCVGEGLERSCQALLSPDCYKVTAGTGATGDTNDSYKNDRAILIGSMFETGGAAGSGSTGPTNQRREESAIMAVQEINSQGGIPGATIDTPHPLVMVSCDTAAELLVAGAHLVNDLHVAAIDGPNQGQDVLDLTPLTAPAKVAVLSPTGVASSIATLNDDGYTFQMVPNDNQRAPLMNDQINLLESQFRAASTDTTVPIRMAVLFRNDALGQGTEQAMNSLTFNGAPLALSPNRDQAVQLIPYDPVDTTGDAAILQKLLTLKPNIIVLAGNQEIITRFVTGTTVTPNTVKLEEMWDAVNAPMARPSYIGIDSTKNSALYSATKNTTVGNALRLRVRGTGVTSGLGASKDVYTQFLTQYSIKYPGKQPDVSGTGSSYDAAYAIAFAMAASGDAAKAGGVVNGESVTKGLPFLSGGSTTIAIQQSNVTAAFQHLTNGEHISAIGTFGAMAWDQNGAKTAGVIEVWCLQKFEPANTGSKAASTSREYDVGTATLVGTYDGAMKCL